MGHLIYPIMEAIAKRYETDQPILNWEEGLDVASSLNNTEKWGQNETFSFSDTDPPQTQSRHKLESVTIIPHSLNEFEGQVKPQTDTTERAKNEHKYSNDWYEVATRLGIDPESLVVARTKLMHDNNLHEHLDQGFAYLWWISGQNETIYYQAYQWIESQLSEGAKERIDRYLKDRVS